MKDKISLEIKEFLIDRFSSESDFDNLCNELDIKNVFSGSYDTRITGLIKTIERDLPDYADKLYNSAIRLKRDFKLEIDSLFNADIEQRQETIAVLFSDVKGYSKIKSDSLKEKVSGIIQTIKSNCVEDPNCIFVNTWGDALYILYRSPSKLLDKAQELREKFIHNNWQEEGFESPLKIRIGLNIVEGTIFYKNGKVVDSVGVGIDESARIEPVVAPNNIFVSQTFFDVVKSHTDLQFKYLGERRLAKDYGELDLYCVEGGDQFEPEAFFSN